MASLGYGLILWICLSPERQKNYKKGKRQWSIQCCCANICKTWKENKCNKNFFHQINPCILFSSEGMLMQVMTVPTTFRQDATWRQEPALIKASKQNSSTPETNFRWKQSKSDLWAQQCLCCIYSLLLL